MLQFLRRIFARGNAPLPQVIVDADGFVVAQGSDVLHSVRWASVVAMIAYKRDRLTTDEVILAFRQANDPELVLQISEEWPGFADLFAPLEEKFQLGTGWYLLTTGRPFDVDFQVLFDTRANAGMPPTAAG